MSASRKRRPGDQWRKQLLPDVKRARVDPAENNSSVSICEVGLAPMTLRFCEMLRELQLGVAHQPAVIIIMDLLMGEDTVERCCRVDLARLVRDEIRRRSATVSTICESLLRMQAPLSDSPICVGRNDSFAAKQWVTCVKRRFCRECRCATQTQRMCEYRPSMFRAKRDARLKLCARIKIWYYGVSNCATLRAAR